MTDFLEGSFEELTLEEFTEDQSEGAPKATLAGNVAGFVVVLVSANQANRAVWAKGFVNGTQICAASAADQNVAGVRSSATQSFTMPVPRGTNFHIQASTTNQNHVRVFRIRA